MHASMLLSLRGGTTRCSNRRADSAGKILSSQHGLSVGTDRSERTLSPRQAQYLTPPRKPVTINATSKQRDDRKEYVHPTGQEREGHRLKALLPAAGRKCVRERGGCRCPPASRRHRLNLSDKREWNRGVYFASQTDPVWEAFFTFQE